MRQGPTRAWIRTILVGAVMLALGAAACGVVPNDGTPPSTRTLCGASFATEPGETSQQALDRTDNYYGGLDMVRVFYPELPDPWPGKLHTNGRPLVVSFKARPGEILAGTHDTTLRDWFATAPRDQHIYWSYYHEPEEDITAGKFSARKYRKAWAHLRALADTADNPRLHATLILMSWSLEPDSGRNWRKYYPGRDVIQVLGWDTYNFAADEGRYEDPVEMYARTIATSKAEGLPFGIAETGSHLVPGDHGKRRAAWIRTMTHHLTEAGALWVAYFDLDWETGDYRLTDPPSRKAWSDFC
jgi:hypothetical protein